MPTSKPKVIYEPKGEAREYAPLAVNPRIGCEHACLYCYAPRAAHKKKAEFHSNLQIRQNILALIERDAANLNADNREILLSFFTDPYTPSDVDSALTRRILKILMKNRLRFTVLTKGGTRATRDFDLLASYEKSRFGSSLVVLDQADADYWEPCAAPIQDRIRAIKIAHAKRIKTWVSLEPVIDPIQAIQIVRELHPIVDHWKVGKLNYQSEAKEVDWRGFRIKITKLLNSLGADYYIKKSLANA
jgi:DNA repair photolyase